MSAPISSFEVIGKSFIVKLPLESCPAYSSSRATGVVILPENIMQIPNANSKPITISTAKRIRKFISGAKTLSEGTVMPISQPVAGTVE